MTPAFEITAIAKSGGPLTKRIWIDDGGSLHSDGSQCIMTAGRAFRLPLSDIGDLVDVFEQFESKHAITLGRLRPGLQDGTIVLTQRRLSNADPATPAVARTKEYFIYEPGRPALALLDFDAKGMPPAVAERIAALGGFEAAVASVLPAASTAGRLQRASTSAGLFRSDTGEQFPASGGLHLYLAIRDGADAERFLKDLHARLFVAGLGWLMLGAGGQLLERSIADRVVGSPERLVFEGPPVLVPPVAQDIEARRPNAIDGGTLDTVTACPPLSILELSEYRAARARQASALDADVATARTKFIKDQADRIAERTGASVAQATRIVERQCSGVLLPSLDLPFDDPDLAGATVAGVLADPNRFVGETLADPLEGVGYGRCKAKIMRRADGSIWINSFAHGRTVYDLRLDGGAVEAAVNKALPDDVADTFVRLVLAADLTVAEIERLREIAARKGTGKRTLDAMLKEGRQEAAAAKSAQRREQRLAERRDPRPLVPAPLPDAEWLPVVTLLNTVHARSTADEPPMRERGGDLAMIKTGFAPSLHMLASDGSTKLPAPPQALITKLSEPEAAEMIERHVEFQEETADGYRSVHLAPAFVRHFMNRSDRALPVVTGIASLPIVLSTGQLLSGAGLDRKSGIVFRIPHGLKLPIVGQCDPAAVGQAMDFLTNQWLVDVATDYPGKCVLIACALSVIERMALPERPVFWVTAGQRGGGKTTALHMLSVGVLGARAAAAAWSPNDEERRKALFAYLGAGLPLLVWDNVPLGAAVSCPSIEKALTAETYSDRVLGESRHLEVPAYTIMAFTGNNVTARGDLAARSLSARLSVDRTDPENRAFRHPDPIAWTEQHRADILHALFTVLLGNPRLADPDRKPPETRFKAWWHLVGAAIEHAADQHAQREGIERVAADPSPCPAKLIRCRDLFLDGETDDEMSNALASVLETLRHRYPSTFQASDVAMFAGAAETGAINFKAALEMASGKALPIISSPAVSWRLKAIKDRPILVGAQTLALRFLPDKREGGHFSVAVL